MRETERGMCVEREKHTERKKREGKDMKAFKKFWPKLSLMHREEKKPSPTPKKMFLKR